MSSNTYISQFIDVDVSALMLDGLSRPWQRVVAFYFHAGLLLVFIWMLVDSPLARSAMSSDGQMILMSICRVGGVVLLFALLRRLLFPSAPGTDHIIHRYSVLGAIEEHDSQVYVRAVVEIERAAKRGFWPNIMRELVQYEPELRSWNYLRIVAHQRRGTLTDWLNTRERVRTAARLVHLFYLAEQRREDSLAGRETEVF